ncbi:MAG: PKD domain-containing protein [Bacteroidota bacterium]
MKKLLLISSGILILGIGAFAQNADKTKRKLVTNTTIVKLPTDASRTVTCNEDTLLYSYLKEVFEQSPTFYLDPLVGPKTAWSQVFELNGSITITGIQFWGNVQDAVNAAQTITAKAYLYSVNASNMPLAKIDSATVLVGTNQTLYTALFNTPVTVSSDYAVVIQNPSSTDTLGVVVNNASAATYGEGLAWNRSGSGMWNTSTFYWGQDAEPVIAPIVKYNAQADYTVTADTAVCLGTSLTFTDNSSPLGVLGHRMYNYRVFASHWGTAEDSTYTWNLESGVNKYTQNTSHAYSSAGTFFSSLTVMGGLYERCIDTKTRTITIIDTAKAVFAVNTVNSPTIAFTNFSTGAATYSWDFGDGSSLSTVVNPTHTYTAVGTYTVTLTATSATGCTINTKKKVVTIVSIGIDMNLTEVDKIYTNPSTNMLSVDMNATKNIQVEILNVLGKIIYSQEFSSSSSPIDLSSFSPGIYFVRASTSNKSIVKKIWVR